MFSFLDLGSERNQQTVISFIIVATCAQISPAGFNQRHMQFPKQVLGMRTPDNISVVCRSVSWIDGGRGCPQSGWGRRESHTGGFVLWTALKQVQSEIKEDTEGGGGTVSQGEENSLLWNYPVSEYNVIFPLRQCSDSLTSRQGWKSCKLD